MSAKEKVYFDVYLPDLDKWIQKCFRATLFEIDGRRFRLFRVGVLARVLCRTTRTITEWERRQKIPEPIFKVTLTGDYDRNTADRWYSEAQIRMMQKHMREILSDRLTRTKSPVVDHEAFFKVVRRDWAQELEE